MKKHPEIEWLQRKWNLPASAESVVLDLLEAERRGSTACEIQAEVSDWGGAAGPSNATTPLVLVKHDGKQYLQSRRLHRAERDIATRILQMAGNITGANVVEADISQLFPTANKDDLQANVARVAVSRQLTIITGGPGTGKTYTLARILALLVAAGIPVNGIRLAAPTGKAADRMKTAISDSLEGLPVEFKKHQDFLVRIAESSSTLHKLLGYNPQQKRCQFDAQKPLPCKVLIVDECSMIDALLWRALLQALPSDARVILLGDPNQLESVGQGNVFAELARIACWSGSKLGPAHVHLTEARRFRERPDILAFAQALEKSDAAATVELLGKVPGDSAPNGLGWLPSSGTALPCSDFPKPILEALEKVARAATPQEALNNLGNVCILTAQREYFVGSKAMSSAIEKHFSAQTGVRNQPIIINRNDPETGLRNGTVGVIHAADDGTRRAWFHSGDGNLRAIAIAKLPDFSPAWAITIHRSQGSEYEAVMVILPRQESPMATRELLYTAITRARLSVYVAGELEAVHKAAETPSNRRTILASFFS